MADDRRIKRSACRQTSTQSRDTQKRERNNTNEARDREKEQRDRQKEQRDRWKADGRQAHKHRQAGSHAGTQAGSRRNCKHWFTTSFLQPLPYLATPQGPENCQLTSSFLVGAQTVVSLFYNSPCCLRQLK